MALDIKPLEIKGSALKISDRDFEQLRDYIYNVCGIYFHSSKKYFLESRLARRMEMQERRTDRGARREARMRELVRRYDRNGDGVVTPDEMPPGLARRLQRLDRNGDGWLDERDRP